MPRKQSRVVTKVIAYLPYSVDLTKLSSSNTPDIQVRSGEEMLGTLKMGRGSVQWWPKGNKTNSLHRTWRKFAENLTQHLTR